MLLYSKKYAAPTRAGTGEEAMGFFNELKDAWNSGGGIVTKTIEATNREAGLKKVQTVAEMRAKGYELVNEISEQGVIENMFGKANAATRYTLTFQYSEELAARVRQEQEERRKAEEERRKAEEERRKAEEERARLEREERARIEKEHESWRQRCDAEEKKLREALGHGWSITLSGEKQNRKAAVAATYAVLTNNRHISARKEYMKELAKKLKKFGSALVMNDFGEGACRAMCEKLQKRGVKSSVVKYDGAAVQAQRVKRKPNGSEEGAYNGYIENMLSGIAYDRIGDDPETDEVLEELYKEYGHTEPDPNATDELYEELRAAQQAYGQGGKR